MPNFITRQMPNPKPNPEAAVAETSELELIEQPNPLRSVYWCHMINEAFMISVGGEIARRFSNDEERLVPIECPHCNWTENLLAVSKPGARGLIFYIPSWWVAQHTVRAMFSMLTTYVVSGPPEMQFPVVQVVQRVDYVPGGGDRPTAMPDVTTDVKAVFNHATKKFEIVEPPVSNVQRKQED